MNIVIKGLMADGHKCHALQNNPMEKKKTLLKQTRLKKNPKTKQKKQKSLLL